MKKFFLKTFGCQMNHSDSERLSAVLENIAFAKTENVEAADVVILNTCSIKQHAEDRVYGFVHNAKKKGKLVGLTGCMVRKTSSQNTEKEEKDDLVRKYPKIDFVFRIEDIAKVPTVLQEYFSDIAFPEIAFDELDYLNISPKLSENFRAFVPIMTGCDKFCTYCIVPFTRGRERSRSFESIISECQKHLENGAKEITLVGQNVNAYFLDDATRKTLQRQTDFAFLLDEVAKLPNLKRLKFTSPHPRHMGDDVLEVIAAHQNIYRHLHLPVQSGSSAILKSMGREHRIESFQRIVQKAREMMPEMTFATDIIVGFCGETEEDFAKTMQLFEEEKFLMAYISKYSPRKGTFSGDKMQDDVSEETKRERLKILTQKLGETALVHHQNALGTVEEVLVEKVENGRAEGKSHRGISCGFSVGEKGQRFVGELVKVKITEVFPFWVNAEML